MRVASRLGTVFSLLGAFVATAVAMGLIVACLFLPAIGAAGQATNGGVKLFNDMPGSFAMNPLAQQSRILASDGSVLATPFNQNRIVVPFSKISKTMKQAQVAIEDERFYQHGALDSRGLFRAIGSNVFSNGTQGASTLTQQYVKIAIQNEAINSGNTAKAQQAVSRTGMEGYVRKIQQLKYAVSLEQKYTKDQILDGYLNLVYYGGQAYGVEAAARQYFGIHASQLNLPQSALLAGVVNEPGTLDPFTNATGAVARRNVVLAKMYQQKLITRAQMIEAQNTKLKLNPHPVQSNSCANSKYAYFCYYVISWLQTQPSLGKSPKERMATLESGGLTIQTSFNPKMADIIDKQIRAKVPQGNKAGIDSAGVIVQPGTGLVLASGQNTKYSNSPGKGSSATNFAAPDGGYAYGSTAKIFAVITALENGWSPSKTVSVPSYNGKSKAGAPAHIFTHTEIPGQCGLGGDTWTLPNDAPQPRAGSKMSLTDATAQSVNTVFAKIVGELGACNVMKTTTQFGVKDGSGGTISSGPASITLGTSNTTPINLANAYATVASGGMYCPPHPVVSIKDGAGKKLKLSGTTCKRIMTKKVAAETSKIFESVITDPKGTTHGAIQLAGNRQSAGKTGTEDGSRNLWFVGYTPQMATAVWVGHHDTPRDMKNITLAGHLYTSPGGATSSPATSRRRSGRTSWTPHSRASRSSTS
ncbi:transglycosylase domain-containing protein [Flexivirga alba]|uniref:Transglycosylase domain-containing protein n=1 Tax=Flexivirga alba TaxID=702742 RepID=A0ABW2ABU9_9MICO